MSEVAKLDDNGNILSIDNVIDDEDWVTCPVRKSVKLPKNHDMKDKQGDYTFSFERGCFEPKDFLFEDIDSDSPFGKAVRRVLLLLLKHSKITIDEQTKKDLGI